jgi:hypothetical protein
MKGNAGYGDKPQNLEQGKRKEPLTRDGRRNLMCDGSAPETEQGPNKGGLSKVE